MAKKSKKQIKKQQPTRASKKKLVQKVVTRKKKLVVADQKENVVGNNGERVITPEEQGCIEDTRKPEPEITELEEQATIGVAPGDDAAYKANKKMLEDDVASTGFDPKAVIAKYLKMAKNGVK